jgi:branched-chain amino acid transport system ATP-binding protein
VAQSLEVADQAHVLENGVMTLSGAARDIAADPELRRSYLGL